MRAMRAFAPHTRNTTRCSRQRLVTRSATAASGRARAPTQFAELDGGVWVAHRGQRPTAVVHFVGGAFAGAAPQVAYNLLIELLTQEGYTVVTTPYHVTFRHTDTAQNVSQAFTQAVERLRGSGEGHLVPEDVPVYGVGHSNGALLHLFMGALVEPVYDANVVISYNNRQVSESIPIPGFLEGLRPAVQASRQLPFQPPMSLQDLAQAVVTQAAAVVPPALLSARLVSSAAGAIEQLGSVVNEIGDGFSDFSPTPSESRAIIKRSYKVPRTLLVRFTDDNIDETVEMAQLLRESNPAGTTELVLPGSHVTPVGTDVNWTVESSFSPLDAFALAAKVMTQQDVRRLVGSVAQWLEQQPTSGSVR